MADTIRAWLAAHLINVGEEYGGQLSNVPRYTKKKKVQLVEYLTYGGDGDDRIWAKVSDKEYRMPVCFTKVALEEFRRMHSDRLTKYKTAIITIKDFRPTLTRIPIGKGRKGLSDDAFLALECDFLEIIGSIDESEWGRPKEIHENHTVWEWLNGLRQDGGGGNVLKERRKAKAEEISSKIECASPKPMHLQQAKIKISGQSARKTTPSTSASCNQETISPMTEHRRHWKRLESIADIICLHAPSPSPSEPRLELPENSSGPHTPTRSGSGQSDALPSSSPRSSHSASIRGSDIGTPITWPPTSPRHASVPIATPTSQRSIRSVGKSEPYEPNIQSNAVLAALPTPSSTPNVIPATFPGSSHPHAVIMSHPILDRKVPRPQRIIRTNADRVVAPDSDISYSMSQSQSQSQHQLHSQSYLPPGPSRSQGGIQSDASSPRTDIQENQVAETGDDDHDSLFSGSESESSMEVEAAQELVLPQEATNDSLTEEDENSELPRSSPRPSRSLHEAMDVDDERPIIMPQQKPPSSKAASPRGERVDPADSTREPPSSKDDSIRPLGSEHQVENWRVPSFMQRSEEIAGVSKPAPFTPGDYNSVKPKRKAFISPSPRQRTSARKRAQVEDEDEPSQTPYASSKLRGYNLHLREGVMGDGGSWCNWDRLHRILLVTGQARSTG